MANARRTVILAAVLAALIAHHAAPAVAMSDHEMGSSGAATMVMVGGACLAIAVASVRAGSIRALVRIVRRAGRSRTLRSLDLTACQPRTRGRPPPFPGRIALCVFRI